MDADGNLTQEDEFYGARFRLISYLDSDVAVGVFGTAGSYTLGVHRLSSGDPARTIFRGVQFEVQFLPYLSIAWDRDPNYSFFCGAGNAVATLAPPPAGSRVGLGWQAGPWFVLASSTDGTWENSYVLDCSESDTSEGNPILWWGLNNGNNQMWRATTRGLGG
jgi:hypothetical protein